MADDGGIISRQEIGDALLHADLTFVAGDALTRPAVSFAPRVGGAVRRCESGYYGLWLYSPDLGVVQEV